MNCDFCEKEILDNGTLGVNGKEVHEECYDRHATLIERDREDEKRERNDSWRGDL